MSNQYHTDRTPPGRLSTQHVPVTPNFFPAPAVKLVITQYLKTSSEPPFWAWIIVGAFYDADDHIVWSAKLFAGQLDIASEATSSDGDSDTSESSSSLGSESEGSSIRMTTSLARGTPSHTSNTKVTAGAQDRESQAGTALFNAPNVSALDNFSDELCESFLEYISRQRQHRVRELSSSFPTHSTPPFLPVQAESQQPPPAPLTSTANWYLGQNGPVHGQWTSVYDPVLRRWVNRWQQLS
jgi:hypothetical protein